MNWTCDTESLQPDGNRFRSWCWSTPLTRFTVISGSSDRLDRLRGYVQDGNFRSTRDHVRAVELYRDAAWEIRSGQCSE